MKENNTSLNEIATLDERRTTSKPAGIPLSAKLLTSGSI